ncbi:M66 family metalloprotease [Arthrobacter sp.]|uniref:M66 family metalloprotease n=1 Tax=Arthrobacter sp. TaxID=1667 RepID=UPI00289B3DF9|nr:M66 family metalloprotease [Arthrobacter sp.]
MQRKSLTPPLLSRLTTATVGTALVLGLTGFSTAVPTTNDAGNGTETLAGEPASAVVPLDLAGFYDTTAAGTERQLRNDLTGGLAGQVQFAQSHTINAAGNAAAKMPSLVADRAALLLFSPHSGASGVSVAATINGVPQGTLQLAPPSDIPRSDMDITNNRADVAYSSTAWTAELPWNWMKPGLELTFTTDTGTGVLARSNIQFAAPAEMIISSIELGMLTDYPKSDGHYMFNQPEKSGADYFQTIPVSKLTMAVYEPVRLDKVIVSSGVIYEGKSAVNGDVYSGDLRESVGKAQVSTGINLANFGTTSGSMDQRQPGTFNQRIIHHSAGNYANGVQTHGLSGGNGMATLYDSVGNELSHELGHSYGLGHYPGVDTSKQGDDRVINASHHSESGWGYIAYRDRMRSNLSSNTDFTAEGFDLNAGRFTQNYQGLYNYHRDAMSGGSNSSTLSRYTHLTGYSTEITQRSLATVVPDLSYPSGYRDWDAAAGAYVDAKVKTPAFSAPKPAQVGVPVYTLLGGYNPSVPEQTVLYPAFRSNYGNVFDLPQADTKATDSTRRCWLDITFQDGHVEQTALLASNGVKQFNVNLAEADKPTDASIYCRVNGTTTKLGNSISIAADQEPLRPAVVIGQEAGYEALRAVELPELEAKLQAVANQAVPVLDTNGTVLLQSWKDDLSGLTPEARRVAESVQAQTAAAASIDSFIQGNQAKLDAKDPAATAELFKLMSSLGFVENPTQVLPQGGRLLVDGGHCLVLGEDLGVTVPQDKALCADTASQRWMIDVRGAIHSEQRPDLCLVPGTPVNVAACSQAAGSQVWKLEADGHIKSAVSSYLDFYRHQGIAGMYGKTNGANQIWTGLAAAANPGMATLKSGSLATLAGLNFATASIDAFIEANQAKLDAKDPATTAELTALLTRSGFTESPTQVLPSGGRVLVNNGHCLVLENNGGVTVPKDKSRCADTAAQRWFADARGAIHSEARPDLCLVPGTPVKTASCAPADGSQVWLFEADGHIKSSVSSYLDFYRDEGIVGMFSKNAGANQIWTGLTTSANPGMATLKAGSLAALFRLGLDA